MKTKLLKQYSIKVGNAYVATKIFPKDDEFAINLPVTFKNKVAAQAVAEHLRSQFDPALGEVNVCEFLLVYNT